MAYADHEYYTNIFRGSVLSDIDFPPAAERASDYIDYMTRNKATPDSEAVKKACCALAETYHAMLQVKAAGSSAGEIQSEAVGSYSVTYRSGAEASAELESSLYKTALIYLANTGLLYRGGGWR